MSLGVGGIGGALATGIISIIIGVIAIVGGIYAVRRRNFWLAVSGGICALLSFWILGIIGLVLTAMSRAEFE